MSRCIDEQLYDYINDLVTEVEKRRIEDHIYSCDHCLEQYVVLLDATSVDWPQLEDEAIFTDEVMKTIRDESNRNEQKRHQSLVHYVIAACFTLLLLFTGVFDHVTTFTSTQSMNQSKSGSFSVDMLNRTVQLMDSWSRNE